MSREQDLKNLKKQMELDLKLIEKTIYDLETNYLEETL